MFIKSMKLINTIYTDVVSHISGPHPDLSEKKAEIIKDLKDLESILNDFKRSKDEEMKQFTTTFTEILKNNMWPFFQYNMMFTKSELRASDQDVILKSAELLKYLAQTSILKKIFFDDLLFYHYDFLYEKAPKFVDMKSIVDTKIKRILERLTSIREKIEFSKEEFDIDSFVKLGKIKFNVLFEFVEQLVEISTDTLEIEADQIREIFILDPTSYWFCVNKGSPHRVYSLTHHFLKKYNKTMTNFDEGCLKFNSRNYFFDFPRGEESFGCFENKYLSSLNLNITREYNKHCSSFEDTRFSTYRKYEEMIDSCEACKKCCEDMMKNEYCKTHRDFLEKIRSEYFANVWDSFFKRLASSGWFIFEKLKKYFPPSSDDEDSI